MTRKRSTLTTAQMPTARTHTLREPGPFWTAWTLPTAALVRMSSPRSTNCMRMVTAASCAGGMSPRRTPSRPSPHAAAEAHLGLLGLSSMQHSRASQERPGPGAGPSETLAGVPPAAASVTHDGGFPTLGAAAAASVTHGEFSLTHAPHSPTLTSVRFQTEVFQYTPPPPPLLKRTPPAPLRQQQTAVRKREETLCKHQAAPRRAGEPALGHVRGDAQQRRRCAYALHLHR
jgi:hypothetical protein